MTKEEFDSTYALLGIAVHCPTESDAINFLRLADSFGYKWANGTSLTATTEYDSYAERTCYTFHDTSAVFGPYKYFDNLYEDYKVIEYHGFDIDKLYYI